MAHNSSVRVESWPFKVSLWRLKAWSKRLKKVRRGREREKQKDWTDKGKENNRNRKGIEIEGSRETFVKLVREGREERRKEKKGERKENKQMNRHKRFVATCLILLLYLLLFFS